MRYLSQQDVNEFIEKQLEFERRKQQKIVQAQTEKKARENTEFAKTTTFKPTLLARFSPDASTNG